MEHISANLQLANNQYSEFLEFKDAISAQVETLGANDPFSQRNSFIPTMPLSIPIHGVTDNIVHSEFHFVGDESIVTPGYQQSCVNNENIDCEVLFLTDSNLHKMREDIMNHGTQALKLFCPVWKDVEFVVNTTEVKQRPKKIYIQSLTNDIDHAEFKVEEMCSRVREVLENLEAVIDEEVGEVYVSSILPRADKMNIVDELNKELRGIVKQFPYVKFVEQRNIVGSMLRDKKHLNRDGFRSLLANIRFALFGKLPRFSERKPKQYTPRQYYNQDARYDYSWNGRGNK